MVSRPLYPQNPSKNPTLKEPAYAPDEDPKQHRAGSRLSYLDGSGEECDRERYRQDNKNTAIFAAKKTAPKIPANQIRMALSALSANSSGFFAGTLTICAPITSLNFQPKPLTAPYSFTISVGAFSGVLWQIRQLLSSTRIGAQK